MKQPFLKEELLLLYVFILDYGDKARHKANVIKMGPIYNTNALSPGIAKGAQCSGQTALHGDERTLKTRSKGRATLGADGDQPRATFKVDPPPATGTVTQEFSVDCSGVTQHPGKLGTRKAAKRGSGAAGIQKHHSFRLFCSVQQEKDHF